MAKKSAEKTEQQTVTLFADHPVKYNGQRAYPRERGGSGANKLPLQIGLGLSPRTRGKRACTATHGTAPGPIPANAGEARIHRIDY